MEIGLDDDDDDEIKLIYSCLGIPYLFQVDLLSTFMDLVLLLLVVHLHEVCHIA